MSMSLPDGANITENVNGGTPFGLWLKQRRKALGITQKELAERVECSTVTIEKIESGDRKPSSQIAELLADCFNIPADERRAFVEFARSSLASLPSHSPTRSPKLVEVAESDSPAPWRTLHTRSTNLPAPQTAFIGRQHEVQAACDLLRKPNVRLLTISGPPGIGKTRLGLRVAEELVLDFEDGVTFVPLAQFSDPNLVVSAIAKSLGIRDTGGQPLVDSIKGYLKDKRALLVLDNFEQVVSAAPLVTELLSAARWLTVLVTSREMLRVYGEHEFPVPPMSLRPIGIRDQGSGISNTSRSPISDPRSLMQYEAIQLFTERAQAVRPDFVLTLENAPAVVEICSRLDGLPLAIELAAARVRTLSPREIAGRLDSSLELLTGGARDLPERQRALRSAIDWSYDMLDSGERTLFRRLAICAGGFTIENATVICDDDGDLGISASEGIESLLDKSLLRKQEVNGEMRFGMLETIREYAWWRLVGHGEDEFMRERQAAYFLRMVDEAKPRLKGSDQLSWLDRLEREHDNLRAVLRLSLDRGDTATALALSGTLWRFWLTHGHMTEGRKWLAAALEHSDPSPSAVRASALNAAGNLASASGDHASAQPFYEESLSIRRQLGDKPGTANSLNNLAVIAHTRCDYVRSKALHEESLAIKRELGDRWGIASSLGNIAIVANDLGDYSLAHSLHRQSLQIRRELGDNSGIALSLVNLGIVELGEGNYPSARALCDESLAMRRNLGNQLGVAECLLRLGEVEHCVGSYSKAEHLYQQSLDISREQGDKSGIASALLDSGHAAHRQSKHKWAATLFSESLAIRMELGDRRGKIECLAALAGVTTSLGRPEMAAKFFGVTTKLLQDIGFHLYAVDYQEFERNSIYTQSMLKEAEWTAAFSEGSSMSMQEAVNMALTTVPD